MPVYIFQVSVTMAAEHVHTQVLLAGVAMKFHQVELNSTVDVK